MKRMHAVLLLILLLLAPFLTTPALHYCSMQSGAPQASCCCGDHSETGSPCCRLIPVPAGEQLGGVAPGVTPPDGTGMIVPALANAVAGIDFDQRVDRFDHAPPRPPDIPFYLLHSSFLS